jgi:hypothetical protein
MSLKTILISAPPPPNAISILASSRLQLDSVLYYAPVEVVEASQLRTEQFYRRQFKIEPAHRFE